MDLFDHAVRVSRKRLLLFSLCAAGTVAVGCGVFLCSILVGEKNPVAIPIPVRPVEDRLFARVIRDGVEDLREFPSDEGRWGALGLVYEANERFDHARQCYGEAVALRPDSRRWNYRLVRSQVASGDLQSFVKNPPPLRKHFQYQIDRGYCLLELQRVEEAIEAFQLARKLRPTHPAPAVGLAEAQLACGKPRLAIETLQELTGRAAEMEYASYLRTRAEFMLHGSRHTTSIMSIPQRPRFADPDQAELTQLRVSRDCLLKDAVQHAMGRRFGEAIRLLESLNDRFPDDLAVLNYLAAAYIEIGRNSQAVDLLENAISIDPEMAWMWRNLAEAKRQLGDRAAASECIQRALRIDPNYEAAKRFDQELRQSAPAPEAI